jgi:hypothetical protein
MSENTRPILRPLPSGIGRPSWLALLVVATIALGFGAANGYGAGVRSAGAPPASGGGPASPTPAPSTGPSTSAAPSGPVARLTCTPDPNAFDLGDPCPSALEAVERAVAPLGQAVSAIDIEPGPFLCDQLWPGVGRDQCFGTFVRPGRFMHAWAEFMDSPRIAAISLARDGPTVPAASSASSAPSAWRATVEAYEIPPQGWAFPSAPIASPSPNPSTGPAATTFREWTRIDLPDPAPDVFGGATPTGLVAFRGSYITIGTVWAGCCDGDASLDRGVLWASTDGRSWTVRDRIAAFARAAVTGLVSDGIRLVAVGYVAAPVPDELGIPEAALWMSLAGATGSWAS